MDYLKICKDHEVQDFSSDVSHDHGLAGIYYRSKIRELPMKLLLEKAPGQFEACDYVSVTFGSSRIGGLTRMIEWVPSMFLHSKLPITENNLVELSECTFNVDANSGSLKERFEREVVSLCQSKKSNDEKQVFLKFKSEEIIIPSQEYFSLLGFKIPKPNQGAISKFTFGIFGIN
jgi:hypothetical protein